MISHGSSPLLVTLKIDAWAFQYFESLRQAHFPSHRNQVPAHISLFHRLPANEFDCIAAELARTSQDYAPFYLLVSGLQSLGRGVAYVLQSKEALKLHTRLAQTWEQWLTPQDRQRFAPHITIQNKANPTDARALYEKLQTSFAPFAIAADGIDLWRYLNGPWELAQTFLFTAHETALMAD